MRVRLSQGVAVLLLACSALGCLGAIACDDADPRSETSPTPGRTPTVAKRASPIPTTSPTVSPVLSAATRFAEIHSVALPAVEPAVNGIASWRAVQLIPGSHLLLVHKWENYLPCEVEGCQFQHGDPENPGRLALWDPQTGDFNEFRAMEAGKALAGTESDGRFIVWAEGGYGAGGWRLYALELSTMQWWHVDTDFGTVSGNDSISRGDLGFAVGSGYLVYAAAIGNFSGSYLYEMRSYDLATRTRQVLELHGDVPGATIGSSIWGTTQSGVVMRTASPWYVDENANVVWLGPRLVVTLECDTEPYGLYSTDLTTGETKAIVQEGTAQDLDPLRSLTGSSQGRDPGASRWAEHLQVAGGFVVWVNHPEEEPMAFEQGTGDLIKLSDCDAALVAADEGGIYWTCWETDENGQHRERLYWVETR